MAINLGSGQKQNHLVIIVFGAVCYS